MYFLWKGLWQYFLVNAVMSRHQEKYIYNKKVWKCQWSVGSRFLLGFLFFWESSQEKMATSFFNMDLCGQDVLSFEAFYMVKKETCELSGELLFAFFFQKLVLALLLEFLVHFLVFCPFFLGMWCSYEWMTCCYAATAWFAKKYKMDWW